MSEQAEWTVEEAYRQHVVNKASKVPDPAEVDEESITEADKFLLNVVKNTDGMSDAERIKHIHSALGKCLIFVTKSFSIEHESAQKRLESISNRLVAAYKDALAFDYIESNRALLKAFKKLDFSGFSENEYFDFMEVFSMVPPEEMDEDLSRIHSAVSTFREINFLKTDTTSEYLKTS